MVEVNERRIRKAASALPAGMTAYDVLGVTPNATAEEITRAYRLLAKQHHPDRNSGDPVAAQRFKEAATAYELVGNNQARELYERERQAQQNNKRPRPNAGARPQGPGADANAGEWQETNRSSDGRRVARRAITPQNLDQITAELAEMERRGIKSKTIFKQGQAFIEIQPDSMAEFNRMRAGQQQQQQAANNQKEAERRRQEELRRQHEAERRQQQENLWRRTLDGDWQETTRSSDGNRVSRLEVTPEMSSRGMTQENIIAELESQGIKAKKVFKGNQAFVEIQPESMAEFNRIRASEAGRSANRQGPTANAGAWQETNRSSDGRRVARLQVTPENAERVIADLKSKGIQSEIVRKGNKLFVEIQPESMTEFNRMRAGQQQQAHGVQRQRGDSPEGPSEALRRARERAGKPRSGPSTPGDEGIGIRRDGTYGLPQKF